MLDRLAKRRLEDLERQEKYDEAIVFLRSVAAKRELHPGELVKLGRFLQLGSGQNGTLGEARKAFENALEIDPEYLPALLHLGWFHFAVEDNPSEGLRYFCQAGKVAEDFTEELESGRRQCLEEIAAE